MSVPTQELDYSLVEAYLADCKAQELTPSTKDYLVWLQEADLDRENYYED